MTARKIPHNEEKNIKENKNAKDDIPRTASGEPDMRSSAARHNPDLVAEHAAKKAKEEELAKIDLRKAENRNDPDLIEKIYGDDDNNKKK